MRVESERVVQRGMGGLRGKREGGRAASASLPPPNLTIGVPPTRSTTSLRTSSGARPRPSVAAETLPPPHLLRRRLIPWLLGARPSAVRGACILKRREAPLNTLR
jgi:hypothetical protein